MIVEVTGRVGRVLGEGFRSRGVRVETLRRLPENGWALDRTILFAHTAFSRWLRESPVSSSPEFLPYWKLKGARVGRRMKDRIFWFENDVLKSIEWIHEELEA